MNESQSPYSSRPPERLRWLLQYASKFARTDFAVIRLAAAWFALTQLASMVPAPDAGEAPAAAVAVHPAEAPVEPAMTC